MYSDLTPNKLLEKKKSSKKVEKDKCKDAGEKCKCIELVKKTITGF